MADPKLGRQKLRNRLMNRIEFAMEALFLVGIFAVGIIAGIRLGLGQGGASVFWFLVGDLVIILGIVYRWKFGAWR